MREQRETIKAKAQDATPPAPPAEKPAKLVRVTVKCGRCQESCSQHGHVKGKDATPDGAKGYKLYECVRCGLYLEQTVCECCGVEIGALVVSAEDSAEAAAKRVSAR